jgi:hypothetical protein
LDLAAVTFVDGGGGIQSKYTVINNAVTNKMCIYNKMNVITNIRKREHFEMKQYISVVFLKVSRCTASYHPWSCLIQTLVTNRQIREK